MAITNVRIAVRPIPSSRRFRNGWVKNCALPFAISALVNSHPHAQHAAEAAEAAGAQGKFWEMHDMLYENPQEAALDDEDIARYAETLGLDADRVSNEILTGVHTARVREDFRSGARGGVNGARPRHLFIVMRVMKARRMRCLPCLWNVNREFVKS